ncbi:MAG: 4Fe-4S dicluster domain-containing protein [Candidatus Competibacteraceae bacterium]
MFDKDTLIVAYDEHRGEGARTPKINKGNSKQREERRAAGIGDCIDCGYCVPGLSDGIDIRNGLQLLQYISCAPILSTLVTASWIAALAARVG